MQERGSMHKSITPFKHSRMNQARKEEEERQLRGHWADGKKGSQQNKNLSEELKQCNECSKETLFCPRSYTNLFVFAIVVEKEKIENPRHKKKLVNENTGSKHLHSIYNWVATQLIDASSPMAHDWSAAKSVWLVSHLSQPKMCLILFRCNLLN